MHSNTTGTTIERDVIYLASDGRRSMMEISYDVLRRHPGVRLEDLAGPRKAQPIVDARFDAIFTIIEERRDLSFSRVGRFFNRDHSSVLKAYHKWVARLQRAAA